MQSYSRCNYLLMIISVIISFVIFILLSNSILVISEPVILFILFIVIAILSFLSLFLGFIIADRLGNLNFLIAYSGYGNIAMISGILLIMLSLLLLFVQITIDIIFFVFVSIAFFLLLLLLGGIFCFIRAFIRRIC